MNNTVSFVSAVQDPEQLMLNKIVQSKKKRPLKAPGVEAAGDGK